MALRARKVSGAFEKRPQDQMIQGLTRVPPTALSKTTASSIAQHNEYQQ